MLPVIIILSLLFIASWITIYVLNKEFTKCLMRNGEIRTKGFYKMPPDGLDITEEDIQKDLDNPNYNKDNYQYKNNKK